MPNLYPEGYESEVIRAEDLVTGSPVGYRSGVSFDYLAGDYAKDGRNRLLDCTGIESWKSWCINCIQTERYKHLAYSTDFGIELDKVFAAESRGEAESILTREITEAIMADPYGRAEYVDSIEYLWSAPDSVEVRAVIRGIDDVTLDITAYISKGEN